MRKKYILLMLILSSISSFGFAVYDAANHQQNMQNYQMMTLQKLEMVKSYTEEVLQSQQQFQQLQNDATNLTNIGAALIGEENKALLEGILAIQDINRNTDSIIRNNENFEKNYENMFQKFERYKDMDNEQLAREGTRLTREMNSSLKTSMKLANASTTQEREEKRLKTFTTQTSTSVGNLQTQQALKSIGEDQANKLAKIEGLQAEMVRLQALEIQEKMTEKELANERFQKSQGTRFNAAKNFKF